MIWIDYAIIGLLATALIIGLLRGFGLEVFSLAFWVLATGIGLNFSREFSAFLDSSIKQPTPKIAASFALLFLLTLVVGALIRLLLGASLNKPQVSFIARLGGMIVGAAHGMVAMVIIVLLAGLTPMPNDPWWAESVVLPPFQQCAVWLRDHIPSELAAYVHYR